MGIQSNHPLFDQWLPRWTTCQDAVAGEYAVKAKGSIYLPEIALSDPDINKEYRNGASYFNAAGDMIDAMTGIMFSKMPILDRKTKLPIDNIDGNYMSMGAYHKKLVAQVSTTGRLGLWVNYDESRNLPYGRIFDANQCVNWLVDPDLGYTNVIIEEIVYEAKGTDIYELEPVRLRRELFLDKGGIYRQNVFEFTEDKDQWVQRGDTDTPMYEGQKPLDHIPFIFVTPYDISAAIYEPPIEDITSVVLKHYRNSADTEWLGHFACLPTPYGTGIEEDGKAVPIGPTNFLKFQRTDAKLGVLAFDGKSAEVLLKMMDKKEQQMASLGVKLFEQKGGVESGEAKRLRLGASTSTLQTIGDTTSLAMQWMFNEMSAWTNQEPVIYQANRDYLPEDISPERIRAILEAYLKGTLSLESVVSIFSKGNLLPENVSVEEEIDKIKNAAPVGLDV